MNRFTEGIRLTHIETGVEAFVVRDVKPWHKIVARAKRLLACRVAAYRRGQWPVPERPLVRTYHTSATFGTFTKEHRSGVVVPGVFLGRSVGDDGRHHD